MEKAIIKELIEGFRRCPCLWMSKHPHYHNKIRKNACLEALSKILRKIEPNAGIMEVKGKLNRLRAAWRRELRKVQESERSEDPNKEIYQPVLFYYDNLMFLASEDESHISTIDISIPTSEEPEISLKEEPTDHEDMSLSTTPFWAEFDEGEDQKPPLPKRRKKYDFLQETESTKNGDELSSFANYVACRLRSLNPSQSIFARKLINDAIFYGELEALNVTSVIHTTQADNHLETNVDNHPGIKDS